MWVAARQEGSLLARIEQMGAALAKTREDLDASLRDLVDAHRWAGRHAFPSRGRAGQGSAGQADGQTCRKGRADREGRFALKERQ